MTVIASTTANCAAIVYAVVLAVKSEEFPLDQFCVFVLALLYKIKYDWQVSVWLVEA